MPRIRTIKPEFFTSLTVAELTASARLTFVGLWTHVDDDGRCVDEPRLIAAALWPLDDNIGAATVDGHLADLERLGLIVRYRVDGKGYLEVVAWEEHQRISRPTPSKLPPPNSADPAPETPPDEDSLSVHGGLTEDSAQERKGKERKGTKTVADATESDQRFDEHFWPTYPDRKGRKRGKPAARREWHKLTIEEQRRAVRGAKHLALSDEFPKDPERFLRPDDGHYPFDDYQDPPASGPSGGKPDIDAVVESDDRAAWKDPDTGQWHVGGAA